ncbi:MAG: phosphoribosylanthranilate isomerase [Bacteroidetes bacterium]|nr:phosphoribosylanthranilate isomerase [Bacteroidota bacterium]
MKIKVCGLREKENILAVKALGVDLLGMIFYPASPRFVESVSDLPESLNGRTGVFVDADSRSVYDQVLAGKLSHIQLHGTESPGYIKSLRQLLPSVRVIKAFSVGERLPETRLYEGLCDAFLFDAKGKAKGGNGIVFRWDLLKAYQGNTPFFLAGGLGPESVDELKGFSHPKWIGIDLNSRFEVKPGLKDVDQLKEFIEKIRS